MLKLTLLEKLFFVCITNTFCLIRRQRYKLLRKATNLLVKNVSRGKKNHAENNKMWATERRGLLRRNSPREWKRVDATKAVTRQGAT